MPANTIDKVKDLYDNNLSQYGNSSKAVGWNTENCQNLRFEKLTSIISDRSTSHSINDFGCGYGAHLLYLLNEYKAQIASYNGYDVSEKMLAAAHEHINHVKTSIKLIKSSEVLTMADYSFASGTFNVKFESEDSEWQEHIKKCLRNLDKHSARGFSFNLLTSYVDWKEPHLYYGDPCFWFDFCKRTFSKKVSLIHDYDLWEWTILVLKD
jgi:SAM-dependent methyltransferase